MNLEWFNSDKYTYQHYVKTQVYNLEQCCCKIYY